MPQESLKLRLVNAPPVSPQETPTAVTDLQSGDPSQIRIGPTSVDPLLTADEVALRLRVSKDWVWDHSSRKTPRLPVIRMGDGALRYRASRIEEFISEREQLSTMRSGRR
ncbi:MAG: helix-turn-helix transcriptional regulator [Acidobacteriaceae bacterium]